MSLNWNIGKCERPEELYVFQDDMVWNGGNYCFPDSADDDRRNSHRITQQMIFTLMHIGMRSITAENTKEVLRRINVLEDAFPNDRHDLWIDGEWVTVNTDMAMGSRRVGLSTNVPKMTKAQFADAMVEMTA